MRYYGVYFNVLFVLVKYLLRFYHIDNLINMRE